MPTTARIAFLSQAFREVTAEDADVLTTHILARQEVEESILLSATDAQAEVERRQTLRGTLRRLYAIVVPLDDDTQEVDVGNVVRVTHEAYGFSAGVLLRVFEILPDAARRRLTFLAWG